MVKLLSIFFCILFFSFSYCIAQEYSYTNYTDKAGLASNTVYSMCQDKDGFLWFGTAAGASRFDGTNFRNFTTVDGLPDNEIIYTYCDKKGRVWMAPFRKSICYYYKGKIYSNDNDPVLQKLNLQGVVLKICDDAEGNVALMTLNAVHIISVKNETWQIDNISDDGITSIFYSVGQSANGNLLVAVPCCFYEYNCNKKSASKILQFSPLLYAYANTISHGNLFINIDGQTLIAASLNTGKSFKLPLTKDHISLSYITDSSFFRNTSAGALLFDFSAVQPAKKYLKGTDVSASFKDSEGNLWFTSLSKGIFRINSDIVMYVPFFDRNRRKLPAVNILPKNGTDIYVTHSDDNFSSIDSAVLTVRTDFSRLAGQLGGITHTYHIESLSNNKFIIGMSIGVFVINGKSYKENYSIRGPAFKDLAKINQNEYLVATSLNTLRINFYNQKADTIISERSTSVFYYNDTIYAGTLDGIVMIPKNQKPIKLWQSDFLLRSRVTKIRRTSNGIIWFATYNNGLIGYRNGKVITVINEAGGLNNNTCRNLFADGNILWVATGKGVCKIDAAATPAPLIVAKYGLADGLNSEVINAIYVQNNRIYVATDEGLNHFDEKQFYSNSICNLRLTDISVSDRHMPVDANEFYVPRLQSDFEISYAGISFKSGGDITYHYSLKGLDTGWRTTKDTKLNYPSLMPGEYELQLYAVNKFGVKSNEIQIRFTVKKAIWERTGVRIVAGLLLLALLLLLILWRVWILRKREQEKVKFANTIAELEQLAMKSQMNPHFIFNSLNSIQQFVIDKDVEGANRFISSFSRLIRQTLNFSSRKEITLQEEMNYLEDYLSLEKNRLGEKYNYSVESDTTLNRSDIYIPPLLLQPYVENAIRHGIRYRDDNNGVIEIRFYRDKTTLVCTIKDNGIGRKVAMLKKTANPIEYQSKGMSLTAKRIEALNRKIKQPIKIIIEDMYTETDDPTGTRISICFPIENSY